MPCGGGSGWPRKLRSFFLTETDSAAEVLGEGEAIEFPDRFQGLADHADLGCRLAVLDIVTLSVAEVGEDQLVDGESARACRGLVLGDEDDAPFDGMLGQQSMVLLVTFGESFLPR